MTDPAAIDLHAQAKDSSFNKAMLLLPRGKRKALLTLYALCRALDDAVDDAPTHEAAQANLAQWRSEMDAVFAGDTPSTQLAQEFMAVHQHYDFSKADMDAMLDALQRDAAGNVHHLSAAELEAYCYGVAGVVGLMSMRIFGCEQPEARPFAIALGHALQLTNILRDVLTDARIDRVYLPDAHLTAQAVLATPPLDLCATVGANAREYFVTADSLAVALPTRAIAPALAMRDVYATYWRKLHAQAWQPPQDGKIPLNKSEKAALATRASRYMLGRFKPVELSPLK